MRQSYLLLPCRVERWQVGFQAVFQRRALTRIPSIGQPCMVAGDQVSQQRAKLRIFLDGDMGASRGVIDSRWRALQSALEGFGVLAKVVEQSSGLTPWACTEALSPR